ncbi:MAG: hypothetical protein LVQ75_03375 [Candidatus Babeliales bacterium]|jgi:hypothetical protein
MNSIKKVLVVMVSLHSIFGSFSIHPAQAAENAQELQKLRATKVQRIKTREVLKELYDEPEGFLSACATLLLKTARTEERAQALINLCKLLKENPYMNLQPLFTLLEGTDTDTLKRIFSKLSE